MSVIPTARLISACDEELKVISDDSPLNEAYPDIEALPVHKKCCRRDETLSSREQLIEVTSRFFVWPSEYQS